MRTYWAGYAHGQGYPHFQHFVRELKKELKKEEPTPPDSVTTKSGMVVTHAQLLQQAALEEEERLQQEQDRAIVCDPYPVDSGTQAEGMELVAEEFSAEAPGESQMGEHETEGAGASENLTGVLTPQELGIIQRSDTTLKIIRKKVGREGSPYFWEKGILRRQPYSTTRKTLIVLPQVIHIKALRMAHNLPIASHFVRERTLKALKERMDWPGIAKDMSLMGASCQICQKSGPALLSKAPLHPLLIITEPFK